MNSFPISPLLSQFISLIISLPNYSNSIREFNFQLAILITFAQKKRASVLELNSKTEASFPIAYSRGNTARIIRLIAITLIAHQLGVKSSVIISRNHKSVAVTFLFRSDSFALSSRQFRCAFPFHIRHRIL